MLLSSITSHRKGNISSQIKPQERYEWQHLPVHWIIFKCTLITLTESHSGEITSCNFTNITILAFFVVLFNTWSESSYSLVLTPTETIKHWNTWSCTVMSIKFILTCHKISSLQNAKLPAAAVLLLLSSSSGVVSLSGEAAGSGRLWWEVVSSRGRTGWHAAALARKRWPHTRAAWATLTTVWNLEVSVKLTWRNSIRTWGMFVFSCFLWLHIRQYLLNEK